MNTPENTFYKSNVDGDMIFFENGRLQVACYSYYIDTKGELTLSEEETANLYQAMKNHYEQKRNL